VLVGVIRLGKAPVFFSFSHPSLVENIKLNDVGTILGSINIKLNNVGTILVSNPKCLFKIALNNLLDQVVLTNMTSTN
jgi:hypothetical protein